MDDRRAYFDRIAENVDAAVEIVRSASLARCLDIHYLERELIPALGLNNEMVHQQPRELAEHMGRGLHIWQYPNQLARCLAWLAINATEVRSYMEIGCRWGGTFILLSEWLRKFSPGMRFAVAVDPIEESPLVRRYREIAGYPVIYQRMLSTSREFLDFAKGAKPDVVFIDGDHRMAGVMTDHAHARKYAKIILHHDIASRGCPDTTLFWQYLKLAEDRFEAAEFVQQYESVEGNFLGIGVLKRIA
ncbi:class I SAM-dependent methyltransferase [Phenylobacterium sp.]|uniref:class I SAM-dependent methyltransferase n=1 Tax=Phenylobacterium sp. TaxID=1871053 RepID=UPI00391BE6EE